MTKLLPELNNIHALNGQDKQNILAEVYTMYSNRYKSIDFSIKLHKKITYIYYKKGPKKGQVKEIKIQRKSTKFTKVITYLTKNNYTKEIIENILKNDLEEEEIRLFFNVVLYYLNKYNDRIMNLVQTRRKRLLNKTKQIQFKSRTYKSTDQNTYQIVKENKNKKSIIQSFITIGPFPDRKRLHIPTKTNKEYHGNLEDYGTKNSSYIVKIEDTGRIRFILTKECTKYEPKNDFSSIMGVDINVKNNLFSISTNDTIDYDRDLIKDYLKFLKKTDKIKNLGKKNKVRRKKWLIRLLDMYKRKARELVNKAKEKNIKTIVLEDIELMSSSMVKNLDLDIKYSRLIRILHLGSIKYLVRSIASKEGIDVVFTNPAYTSQQCSNCGIIDKNNRKTQEEYICSNCGISINADINASINILNRVRDNKLYSILHKKTKEGFIEPKSINNYKVKDLIKEALAS